MDRANLIFFGLIVIMVLAIGAMLLTVDFSRFVKKYSETSIKEIIADPEEFKDRALNISGYLEYIDNVNWMLLLPHIYIDYMDMDGDGEPEAQTRIGFTWVERNLWIFHLHETPEENSPYITVVKESGGVYIGIGLLPFWFSPDFTSESMEKGVIYPEEGRAIGDWVYRDIKEHGKMWFLDPDKLEG